MTKNRLRAWERRRLEQRTDWTAEDVGLDPARYRQLLAEVFDRPLPGASHEEWYWDLDATEPDATPLEWTRFQTVLFANAGTDLAPFDDERVGMGLRYLMDNGNSDVPYAAVDPSVPVDEALRMIATMPGLWRDVFGPRLGHVLRPIGSGTGGRLGSACYMWFDVWPSFHLARDVPGWRDALWTLLASLLAMPWREVQLSALHGIGHNVHHLDRQSDVDAAIAAFVRTVDPADEALRAYAEAARVGRVQ
jgi:hypothetical protein